MDDKSLEYFKSLMNDGKYDEAEQKLRQIMEASPDDWKARMLFGTCRKLQGDEDTARKILDEAEKHYNSTENIPEKEKSFFKKYRALIIAGAAVALVAAGYVSYIKLKQEILQEFFRVGFPDVDHQQNLLYGGPDYYKRELYGGPGYIDMVKERKNHYGDSNYSEREHDLNKSGEHEE